MTIPKPAIDATIGQLEHLASAVQDRLAAQAGDDNETWWTVDQVLAALLDGAEVREEWGCRLTIPDGEIPDCWRESREAAEAMVSWHINNQSIATPALIRRLHLTLAAEVMETEEHAVALARKVMGGEWSVAEAERKCPGPSGCYAAGSGHSHRHVLRSDQEWVVPVVDEGAGDR